MTATAVGKELAMSFWTRVRIAMLKWWILRAETRRRAPIVYQISRGSDGASFAPLFDSRITLRRLVRRRCPA